jgi:transposase
LQLEEQIHELLTEERSCPACNGQLEEMGDQFEETEEITVVQRQFKLIQRRRRKYRCRCNGAVVTAPGPQGHLVRPGGRYSVEFAVEVAVDKYLNHLPLDRQRRMMLQQGLLIDTQTLWDQLFALYGHLKPSYDALLERILGQPQIGADETWWRLMERKANKKWWDWCLATEDAVYHRLHPSRAAEVVENLLAGYEGVVMSDGFAAYETLTRETGEVPKRTLLGPRQKEIHRVGAVAPRGLRRSARSDRQAVRAGKDGAGHCRVGRVAPQGPRRGVTKDHQKDS